VLVALFCVMLPTEAGMADWISVVPVPTLLIVPPATEDVTPEKSTDFGAQLDACVEKDQHVMAVLGHA